jgi:cell division ATPase FtsA
MIALDVGTRSLVCAEHDDGAITRLGVSEHALPCMREGTVHDLAAAAASIRALRESMGLAEGAAVSVAIAGGSLISRSLSVTIAGPGPWTERDLDEADAEAVRRAAGTKQFAHRTLLGTIRSAFRHDGRPGEAARSAGSLLGLEGTRAEYRLLATWLPLETVRVKLRAIEAGGFSPTRITVEPIAIGRALFGLTPPPGNFAVIDIGAGTSDIALLSPDGLSGVASVPLAGDTITEVIAKKLGLSYLEADRVKRDPDTPVIDLWGAKKTWSAREILRSAEDGVAKLVEGLAAALRDLDSERRLDGVILVGGGSLWSDLPERLADAIGLSEERVRVRPSETVPGIEDQTGLLRGPAFLTVLGIILSEATAYRVTRVTVNGREALQVAAGTTRPGAESSGGTLTVAEAIKAAGEDPIDYFGEPGEARVEGDSITPGGVGGDPVITVSGATATLDTRVSSGDTIAVTKGMAGDTGAGDGACAAVQPQPLQPVPSKPVEPQPLDGEARPSTGSERAEAVSAGQAEVQAETIGQPPLRTPAIPLATLVALPVNRSIAIRIDGRDLEVKDRTRSAIVNGRRTRAGIPVLPASTITTERAPWRVYEALGGRACLPRRILVNGREAGLMDELRAGDEVVIA